MSDSDSPKVLLAEGDDPALQRAYEMARDSFRLFWREISWEQRRIVPAFEMYAVKAPFSDGKARPADSQDPEVEHMWVGQVTFDGQDVAGVLLDSPQWLVTVEEGDAVCVPLNQVSDWMYVLNGEVYGAYTVNLMRSRMNPRERKEHDQMWGLKFGDPDQIRLPPADGYAELQVNGAESLRDALRDNPSYLSETDDNGWTLLQQEALAGSAATVKLLLEAGADPNVQTPDGTTPLQLAQALGWDKVVELLVRK